MKRCLSIIIIICIFLLCCSCSNQEKTTKKIKIGVIDSCISDTMVQELGIKKYYKISEDITNNNLTHGSIITKIIQQEIDNCDIYYYSIYDGNCRGKYENVVYAITKCIEDEVDCISMSFATLQDDLKIRNAIELAQKKDIIIIASCINFSDRDCYPAMYEGVISVTDGFNKNATINLNGKIVQVELCGKKLKKSEVSFLTAYTCGKIAKKMSQGATIDVIKKNLTSL